MAEKKRSQGLSVPQTSPVTGSGMATGLSKRRRYVSKEQLQPTRPQSHPPSPRNWIGSIATNGSDPERDPAPQYCIIATNVRLTPFPGSGGLRPGREGPSRTPSTSRGLRCLALRAHLPATGPAHRHTANLCGLHHARRRPNSTHRSTRGERGRARPYSAWTCCRTGHGTTRTQARHGRDH